MGVERGPGMSILLLLAAGAISPGATLAETTPAAALDYGRLIDDAIEGGRIVQAELMLSQWRDGAQAQDKRGIDITVAQMALAKVMRPLPKAAAKKKR